MHSQTNHFLKPHKVHATVYVCAWERRNLFPVTKKERKKKI